MSEPNDPAWLLARERGEDVSHVPEAHRATYAELERLIAALPDPAPSPGWKARVLETLDPPAAAGPTVTVARSRRRWVRAAAAVAAAAVAVLVLYPWGHDDRIAEPIATTEIRRGPNPHRADGPSVGDTLVVRAEAARPLELRVYGDADEPLARCPGAAGCTVTHDGQRYRYMLELALRFRGSVRTMLFAGDPVPAAFRSLDADVEAAHEQGIEARQVGIDHVQ